MANRRIFDIIFRTKGLPKASEEAGGLDNKLGGVAKTAKAVAVGFVSMQTALKTVEMARLAAQTETVRRSFGNLAKEPDKMLQAMKRATAGTISEMELMQKFNQAALLGLPLERFDEMLEVARGAAQATGESMDFMLNSIVTGLGRQSKLMLDNLGIMIDVKSANEEYAESIGKTASQLTDQEKKQAFVNKALDLGQENLAKAGGVAESNIDTFASLNATFQDLQVSIGQELIPLLVPLIKNMVDLMKAVDPQRVIAYTTSLGVLTAGFGLYKVGVMQASVATKAFRATLIKSGVGVALVGLGELINALMEHNKNQKESAKIQRNSFEAMQDKLALQYEELNTLQEKLEKEQELDRTFFNQEKNLQRLIDQQKQKIAITIEDLQTEGKRLTQLQETAQFVESMKADIFDMPDVELFSEEDVEAIDGIIVKVDDAGKAFNKMSEEQGKLAKKNQEALLETAKAAALNADSAEDAMERVVRAAFMEAVAKQIAKIVAGVPFPFNIGLAAGAGAVMAGLFDKAVGEAKKLKFAQFGMDEMVSSPTLILAGEAGPERVQVTPKDRTASESKDGLTINFLGPVTNKEFVRDTIIPEIQKVTKLGLA